MQATSCGVPILGLLSSFCAHKVCTNSAICNPARYAPLMAMEEVTKRKTEARIALRVTADLLATLSRLTRLTGLSRSGVIKLAISEMAERRLPSQHPDRRV